MIKGVTAQDFKGLSFGLDLEAKTLITGNNGTGKSAVGQALQLATLGYIPEKKTKKKNQDIFQAYGTEGKPLIVGVVIDGRHFETRFSKSSKGSVSKRYRLNGGSWNMAEKDYYAAMAAAGSPRVIDLDGLFLSLSDQKQIDLIFNLFPPAGDVVKIDREIEKLSETLKRVNRERQDCERTRARLVKSRAEIELPAGTLAEVQLEIERTTAEVKLCRDNIRQAEIRAAEAAAKEKAEREVAEKAAREREHQQSEAEDRAADAAVAQPELDRMVDDVSKPTAQVIDMPRREPSSIQRIIDTIEMAGCTACAALLVAKREMRKEAS